MSEHEAEHAIIDTKAQKAEAGAFNGGAAEKEKNLSAELWDAMRDELGNKLGGLKKDFTVKPESVDDIICGKPGIEKPEIKKPVKEGGPKDGGAAEVCTEEDPTGRGPVKSAEKEPNMDGGAKGNDKVPNSDGGAKGYDKMPNTDGGAKGYDKMRNTDGGSKGTTSGGVLEFDYEWMHN